MFIIHSVVSTAKVAQHQIKTEGMTASY